MSHTEGSSYRALQAAASQGHQHLYQRRQKGTVTAPASPGRSEGACGPLDPPGRAARRCKATWDDNHAKPEQQQKTRNRSKLKALTVRQARQSFHRGSICEDGLVENVGHV